MKERPILFSGPMVRAILEGLKTQTRRVVKFPKSVCKDWDITGAQDAYDVTPHNVSGRFGFLVAGDMGYADVDCPYGAPGDRMWVRETFSPGCADFGTTVKDIHYRADSKDHAGHCWRPSIFMPRSASRITLEVTGVRVERVQDITYRDCEAEGLVHGARSAWLCPGTDTIFNEGIFGYQWLWNKINGKTYPWESNPWVWVIEFRRLP